MKQFMMVTALLTWTGVAAAADPLNVKPGLWETTSTGTTTVTGAPMGPDAATLNSMTPAQRARVEAMLKQQALGQPTVRTSKSCVTPAQVAKGLDNFTGTPSLRCTTEVLQKTPTDYRFQKKCREGDSDRSGQSDVEVKLHLDSPESATMTMDGVHTGDGRTMKMSHKAVSKWLGSDCGSVGKGSSPR